MGWNLDHIVSLKNWPKLYQEIEADLAKVEKWWQKMSPDMSTKDFAEFVLWEESFGEKISRLYCRGHLWEAADQKSAEAKKLKAKAHDLAVKASLATTKIGHWMKGKEVVGKKTLDNTNAKRLFAAVPDLEYGLHYSREAAKHTLSEAEETLATEKDAYGQSVLLDLRDALDTDLSFSLKLPGRKKPLVIDSLAGLKKYTTSPNRAYRRLAYEEIYRQYSKQAEKLFLIYQGVVKDWSAMTRRRGFKSAIAGRNFSNHIPDQAIEALLSVAHENRSMFQDFFKIKAKALGLRQLAQYDLYAPIGKAKAKFGYQESAELVLAKLVEFSPGFGDKAKKVFAASHLDVFPSKSKQGGAFCSTVGPSVTPYILLNHVGTWRDVSTLAHELGHAIHSLYANHHLPSSQHASIPLCETASTFCEMLLFDQLLAKTTNKQEKVFMLADKIGDFFAGGLRPTYVTKFEMMAHDLIPKGAGLAELDEAYGQLIKDTSGSAVKLDPMFNRGWMHIPHLVHTPFYYYSYSFGELLSLALYSRYKKEGQSFVPQIEKILAAGGSENPDKILKAVGIDMTDPKFWQGSFEVVKDWIKELKSLS